MQNKLLMTQFDEFFGGLSRARLDSAQNLNKNSWKRGIVYTAIAKKGHLVMSIHQMEYLYRKSSPDYKYAEYHNFSRKSCKNEFEQIFVKTWLLQKQSHLCSFDNPLNWVDRTRL